MPPQFLVVFSLTPTQMGLSCCLTMATIVPKTIRGHRYYYLVQTAWVNGRSRYVKQLYLGKAEDIGKLFEEATAPVPIALTKVDPHLCSDDWPTSRFTANVLSAVCLCFSPSWGRRVGCNGDVNR